MSLYARLLALTGGNIPTEDALTEIVAHLFRRDLLARIESGKAADDALVVRWLRAIGALEPGGPPARRVRVETQRSFSALPSKSPRLAHSTNSRPDLVLTLYRGSVQNPEQAPIQEVVFVESKVGSGEGHEQLRRYAEHLDAAFPEAARRTLVYLTHYPDRKEVMDVLEHTEDRVGFQQTRWHSAYRLFRAAHSQAPTSLLGLYDDLLDFMQHLDMDRPDHLDLADGFALTRINRGLRFLKHTLADASAGAVAPIDRLQQLMRADNVRYTHMQNRVNAGIQQFNRFAYVQQYNHATDHFEADLGYLLDQGDLPTLYLNLAAAMGPVAERIQRLLHGREVTGLQEGASWEKWTNPKGTWGGARVLVPFAHLLTQDDQAEAARQVFDRLLNELEHVQKEHRGLPWWGEAAPEETEDGLE